MSKNKTIIAPCDYVQGNLRGGFLELTLNEEELEIFKGLSEPDKLTYIEELGSLEVTDWRVEDYSISDWEYITE